MMFKPHVLGKYQPSEVNITVRLEALREVDMETLFGAKMGPRLVLIAQPTDLLQAIAYHLTTRSVRAMESGGVELWAQHFDEYLTVPLTMCAQEIRLLVGNKSPVVDLLHSFGDRGSYRPASAGYEVRDIEGGEIPAEWLDDIPSAADRMRDSEAAQLGEGFGRRRGDASSWDLAVRNGTTSGLKFPAGLTIQF
jgi:hypothetical protein